MIDYETYCKIRRGAQQEHLTAAQIALELNLDTRTVKAWMQQDRYQPKRSVSRSSKLDPFKPQIVAWLEAHALTAQQVFQRLCELDFDGGYSIVKTYVRKIRPKRAPAFLTLNFAPGECAQVDWGEYGCVSVSVGETRRRLSFFVMVLCYSRLMYVEFTVSQTMEHFLSCHQRAFEFFGNRVPEKIMIDNLKSGVLRRLTGEAPVFNPRYAEFARHYGFTIKACNVRKGNEKGRVESGVGYVKKNFLNGLELADFSAVNPAAQEWLKQIANVRIHGETHKRPVDLFEKDKACLRTASVGAYDVSTIHSLRVSSRFRITLDTNRYSVPAEYARQVVTVKAYTDRLCVYHQQTLIARHVRCYDRHRDFENPDHPKVLLEQRKYAREQALLGRFLRLSPKADAYYQVLAQRHLSPRHHVQKIVALSEIHGVELVARALEDAFTFEAFGSDYIANIIESQQRRLPEPGALHLTRRQDLLDIDLPEPDLSAYELPSPNSSEVS